MFGTMDLPTQEKELQAIINVAVTKKCQEIHNCSLESTRLIGMNYDLMRDDFRGIVAETRFDWKEDDSLSPGPLGRAVLSPFCKVSTGYWPEEIGHPIALLPAPLIAFLLVVGGVIAINTGKKGETSTTAKAVGSGPQ